MTKSINIEAIENNTGKTWQAWLAFFDSIGAPGLSHKQIAEQAHRQAGVPAWWAQMATVAYEQHIGRRVPGQDCNGEFAVSIGKTLSGTMDEALAWWVSLVGSLKKFSDIDISRGPDISRTEKWRYWRCGLADGSRVTVNIYQKAPGKAAVSIQHERIESSEQAEHWRAYWKELARRG